MLREVGPHQAGGLVERDVQIMAGVGLGGRSEDRRGQFGRLLQAGRQPEAADRLLLAVFFPARAGEVAAHDAFNGEWIGLPDNHTAAGQLGRVRLEAGRQGVVGAGEQMVGLEPRGLRKPEMRELGQHLALARDAIGHDAIEGRNAVGSNKEQAVAQVEDFPHFAALQPGDAG